MRRAACIELSERDRQQLEACIADGYSGEPARLRARMILLAASGLENKQIASELHTDPHTVGRWRNRFRKGGIAALTPRPVGRPKGTTRISSQIADEILRISREVSPPRGNRWSTRSLASMLGIDHMAVYRVLKRADQNSADQNSKVTSDS